MAKIVNDKLLSRDEFRNAVFARDNNTCVSCGETSDTVSLDAHHIMERRLFPDGGYYLSNGATLCDKGDNGCHMKAETTELSVEDVRALAGIVRAVIPPDLYEDHVYDKWGNSILPDGTRTKGPLFHDESVQKVLTDQMHLFRDWVKYPRTYHVPWSEGITDDDKVIKDMSIFNGKEVVVSRKMDGENTSMYSDGYLHARSVDGRSHSSRDWAKSFWANRAYDLPKSWRINAENVYAKHAIKYHNLKSYVLGFAIYNDQNLCLDWDETLTWFELLDIPPVDVLYEGVYNEAVIRGLYNTVTDYDDHEGYVIRVRGSFPYGEFSKSVAKFVRKDHVQTSKHWMKQDVVPNELSLNNGRFGIDRVG